MRIVVALGGNALGGGETPREERERRFSRTASQLADLVEEGHQLVVTHGNGPQVGELLLDQESRTDPSRGEHLPLDVLVAMTQAELGYRLQGALGEELYRRGLNHRVTSIVTQVRVDADDPAFSHPTKPIGPRYDERPDDGRDYTRTSEGQWRRVVSSPAPLEIIEATALTAILEAGTMPICAGGGGIPVVRDRTGHLVGIEAVIDKDATSAMLAEDLDTDGLLILTDVAQVNLDHGTDRQRPLRELTTGDVADLLASEQAPSGSMGPKIQALARAASQGRLAMVGQLGASREIVAKQAGTLVVDGPSTGIVQEAG